MRLQEFFDYAPDYESALRLITARLHEQSAAVIADDCSLSTRCTLAWNGEVTAANAEEIWESTRARLSLAAPGEIVTDLSGVRFIDSSGLGVMVRAKKFAEERGIKLTFTSPQETVRNVIHLARLEGLLLETRP